MTTTPYAVESRAPGEPESVRLPQCHWRFPESSNGFGEFVLIRHLGNQHAGLPWELRWTAPVVVPSGQSGGKDDAEIGKSLASIVNGFCALLHPPKCFQAL
jgi:hypothetical protein